MEVIDSLIVAGVTGVLSTIGTVMALRVHIIYLKESIIRNERSTLRAHERIDDIEKRCKHHET